MPEKRGGREANLAKQTLRGRFESTIDRQVQRHIRAKVHGIIPLHFFFAASAECKDMYVAGSFYGCITLCQSVAEGLSKFLAEKNLVHVKKGFTCRISRLRSARVISGTAVDAFNTVHGEDRNDFHHLNKEIERDYRKLEERALECLDALFTVESEVFPYDTPDGRVQPKKGDVLAEQR